MGKILTKHFFIYRLDVATFNNTNDSYNIHQLYLYTTNFNIWKIAKI